MSKAQRKRRSKRRLVQRRDQMILARHFTDRPVVTIFADASYSRHSKTGSWGVWIKPDGRGAYTKGGPFLGEIAGSVEAEMRALANGLALARAIGATPDGACVMVQSDCMSALSWILGAVNTSCHRPAKGGLEILPVRRKARALGQSAGLRSFVELAEMAKLKVAVRHVPGHKSGSGRAWVNRHVDKVARQNRVTAKGETADV